MNVYLIAALATIGAACFPFVWRMVRAIYRFLRGVSRAVSLVDKELRPNGGSSLKDDVTRLKSWTQFHDGLHKGLEGRGWAD